MEWSTYGGIVAVSNSVRKFAGKKVYHDTDPVVDEWFNKNQFRCVVVLLIDALGTSVLEKHCDANGFFLKNRAKKTMTVFPPTTSAATTSLRTGKNPAENAWLGWNQYFKEIDANIILFMNKDQYTEESYPGFTEKTLPVTFLEEEMSQNSCTIWPSWGKSYPSDTFSKMWQNIVDVSKNTDMHYIYAYYDALDTFMHIHGPSSPETGKEVLELEKITEEYSGQLSKDVGVILLADHSQIDVHGQAMEEHPELVECFSKKPALEPRTIAFYIREDKKDYFRHRFQEVYGDSFDLYTPEEVVKESFFGQGVPHERMKEFIGDFLAVAKSDSSLMFGKPDKVNLVQGDHAGGTKAEADISVILLKNVNK